MNETVEYNDKTYAIFYNVTPEDFMKYQVIDQYQYTIHGEEWEIFDLQNGGIVLHDIANKLMTMLIPGDDD